MSIPTQEQLSLVNSINKLCKIAKQCDGLLDDLTNDILQRFQKNSKEKTSLEERFESMLKSPEISEFPTMLNESFYLDKINKIHLLACFKSDNSIDPLSCCALFCLNLENSSITPNDILGRIDDFREFDTSDFIGAYVSPQQQTNSGILLINMVFENSIDLDHTNLMAYYTQHVFHFGTIAKIVSGPSKDILGHTRLYPIEIGSTYSDGTVKYRIKDGFIQASTEHLNKTNFWNLYGPNENGIINCIIKVTWNDDEKPVGYLLSMADEYLNNLSEMLNEEFKFTFLSTKDCLDENLTVYDQNEFMNNLNQHFFGFEFVRQNPKPVDINAMLIKNTYDLIDF